MTHPELSRSTATCLLLVEKDESVFNQLSALVEPTCLVRWYHRLEDAVAWLRDREMASLIIINETQCNATAMGTLRALTQPHSVPILVLCQRQTTESVQLALRAGATDLLALDEPTQLGKRISFFLMLGSRVSAEHLFLEARPEATFRFKLPTWKRAIDIAASLQALIVFSPLMLMVAALVKLDSKGPVFYKSKRVGANYRVFNMIKFRTMRVEADTLLKQMASENNMYGNAPATAMPGPSGQDLCESCRAVADSCQQKLFDQDRYVCERNYLAQGAKGAAFVKFRNDPRITRLGNFLRNSSLDELPQLVNILLGDMSVVGNRPLPVYEAEKLTTDQAVKRFAGPSGLTGLWQVQKRARGESRMDEQERISLDIEYVESFTFLKDMKIIYQTFFSLWQQENV